MKKLLNFEKQATEWYISITYASPSAAYEIHFLKMFLFWRTGELWREKIDTGKFLTSSA